MSFKIVSLDGGGIRGILTARLLVQLDAKVPGFLDKTDLFAGTSTGAILALGLAKGMPPNDIVNLYRTQGPTIFHTDLLYEVGALWGFDGVKILHPKSLAGHSKCHWQCETKGSGQEGCCRDLSIRQPQSYGSGSRSGAVATAANVES